MELAAFVNGSSTSGTRNQHDLLWGEFTAFHSAMMKDCASKECSILLKSSAVRKCKKSHAICWCKVSKSKHL
jgi:hypothetical protein